MTKAFVVLGVASVSTRSNHHVLPQLGLQPQRTSFGWDLSRLPAWWGEACLLLGFLKPPLCWAW